VSALRSIPHALGSRLALALVSAGLLAALPAAATASVAGGPASTAARPASAVAAPATGAARVHRVGGSVRKAWPAKGRRAPRTRLARWLARQVGPKAPRVCRTLPNAQRRACLAARRPPRAARARIAAATAAVRAPTTAALAPALVAGASGSPIEMLRSYAIPTDDPSYDRLLNWSWSYDSALAAAAFAAGGDREQATRLLDQLAALQRTDGSIEIAFNVQTGEASSLIRSGTVAWLGLAAVTYDAAFDTDRYRDTAERAAGFLLSLQHVDGLVAGGPDVKWVSTQHNLLAYTLLDRLGDEVAGDVKRAGAYREAAATMGTAIDARLLVQEKGRAFFRQGLDDDAQALDTQAIGSMYLMGRGRADLGALVLGGAQSFAVGKRSIERSDDKATFNGSYEAPGPFIGYRPYLGTETPDVLWFEGTAEMRLAQVAFGRDTSELDASMERWAAVTGKAGDAPLGADRTVTDNAFGEYHVWPTGAAGAWSLLSAASPTFFVAAAPEGTRVVTDWTRVRGDEKQIELLPDGRVNMTTERGERRVLAGSVTGHDATVTVDAELLYGSGYGVYVRATTDKETALTGYCLQYDRSSGVIALRQVQDDKELGQPLAQVRPADGFDWNARHRVSVTVRGDVLAASIDGEPALAVPDLAAASAKAAETSGMSGVSAPTAGRYGLRAWSRALVRFQDFTVERAH
jgi:hypothetical protein